MTYKRQRSSSPSPTPSSSPAASPASKLLRTAEDGTLRTALTCYLPPTCVCKPTQLASTRDLESHYATFHSHVCEYQGCVCVFPDERLLELHLAECHDPITALKKERGEKTFACYVSSCSRLFLTPKARRLHLIQAHGYPKEYFFSVTNKGIGGLLSKWGQGATLIRGEWKPRKWVQEMEDVSDSNAEDGPNHVAVREHSLSRMDCDEAVGSSADDHTSSVSAHRTDSDKLADTMSSLSLVPNKIRFGRGGKNGGFVHPNAEQGKSVHSGKTKSADGVPRSARRRGGRRGTHRKASEGTGSTSGDPDAIAMQS